MTVVVAWTPDEFGDAALAHGLAAARDRGDRLVVVNGSRGDAYVDRRFAGESRLEALERRLGDAGVEHEVRQPVSPDVADAVLAVVEEVAARLVVVGVRHRTPVGKLLMGSVAQRLILEAGCPVLAVKPDTA